MTDAELRELAESAVNYGSDALAELGLAVLRLLDEKRLARAAKTRRQREWRARVRQRGGIDARDAKATG